ncbi:MAG: FAD-dependent monooxygenase [Hyphomicrobiales bacterium]|nr:FAD-dependent monooxygenase [Hyphomicrobiales bacterium]MCP5370752.1 FAD-dependent monooxygenase [Hyphomicrobiales bacterium]
MQFHLNGFRTGDPDIAEALPGRDAAGRADVVPAEVPGEVDVLIVGCGPAGLNLAAQLSAFPDISVCIVEQKSGPLLVGQADGIACRTMEMFHTLGFAGRVMREAYWVNETAFWKPDAADPRRIARSSRIQDVEDDLSEFPHVILNQARVHDFFLDVMRHSPSRLEPHYCRQLVDLTVDPAAAFPVTARLERVDPGREGEAETIRARYAVGCDGARSRVRQALGRDLHGDFANQAWGVMDVLAVTDFPDVRLKTVIHSGNEGNLLIIPREGGYMVRMYIELDKLKRDERVASKNITPDHLIAAARRILHPYGLEVHEIAWWSIYEIGQRLCDKFDDVPAGAEAARLPRVFIAGDACHTHSPKAGQGMNVSVRDTFNLGWKLAAVLRRRAAPEILHTYSTERHGVAKELIDFDREFAKMFSAPPKVAGGGDDDTGVDPAVFQAYFMKFGRFTAGTATRYGPSVVCAAPVHQHLAGGLVVGMRFHSAPVIRLADAKPVHLGHAVKADGRWRLFAFAGAGDAGGPGSALRALCDFLADAPDSPLRRYTPAGADMDSVIDLRAVFQQGHRDLAVEAMPDLLLPRKGRYGLRDYEKMFCPDLKAGQDVYDLRGIDRGRGCLVVVRPDQHVAHVLPLDAHGDLAAFFDGFMLPAS